MIKIIPVLIFIFALSVSGQNTIPSTHDSSSTDHTIYDSRIQLLFGWFFPTIHSSIQLDTKGGEVGATVNLEEAFKLPTTRQLFRFAGLYRFNNSSSVDVYYYVLDRSGSTQSTDSLNFGDITINVGASLVSYFNLTLFGSRYHYSILNEKNIEAGVSAGISFLDVDVGTTATINDQSAGDSYDDLLFLPVFGFFNRVKFWGDFTFRDHVDLFALNIQRYGGILIDLGFSLEYLLVNHFSLGVSYDVFTLNVNFDAKQNGNIQYQQRGFILFTRISF